MEKRYLYTNKKYHGIKRYPVTRETSSNIWVLIGKDEERISKKTYRTGSGFNSTYYFEETPELLKSLKKQRLNNLFLLSLDKLRGCKDVADDMKKSIIDMANQIENKG